METYTRFLLYLSPVIVTFVASVILQLFMKYACVQTTVPDGSCVGDWWQMIALPLTVIAAWIAWIVAAIGIIYLTVKLVRANRGALKALFIVIGIILTLVSLIYAPLITAALAFAVYNI